MSVKNEEIDQNRRCFLKLATTAVGGIGLAAAAVPFFSYWTPDAVTQAEALPITVDLKTLKPGQQLTIPWRGMPIWVISRTPAMLATLPKLESTLRDPLSEQNQQPDYCKNLHRSIKENIFVGIGICTHLGCVPTFRPDAGGIDAEWLGGFYCPCHGSRYDLSGRVFKDVPAPLNLKIPRHMYVDDFTLKVGEDAMGVEGAISIS